MPGRHERLYGHRLPSEQPATVPFNRSLVIAMELLASAVAAGQVRLRGGRAGDRRICFLSSSRRWWPARGRRPACSTIANRKWPCSNSKCAISMG